LLHSLGDAYPLETERGYHLMFAAHSELSRSVMHMEKHLVLSPTDDGLRMTAGVELAGLNAPADFDWVRRKVDIARQMLPSIELEEQSTWLGFRPSLPDSNPVIGLHPRWPKLSLAFGHGHLGMTQSAATGYLLAQAVQGVAGDIPMHPYRADRF
jgi:D-amino-acid dehydrogenase